MFSQLSFSSHILLHFPFIFSYPSCYVIHLSLSFLIALHIPIVIPYLLLSFLCFRYRLSSLNFFDIAMSPLREHFIFPPFSSCSLFSPSSLTSPAHHPPFLLYHFVLSIRSPHLSITRLQLSITLSPHYTPFSLHSRVQASPFPLFQLSSSPFPDLSL